MVPLYTSIRVEPFATVVTEKEPVCLEMAADLG